MLNNEDQTDSASINAICKEYRTYIFLLALWACTLLTLGVVYDIDFYWYSYYSVDYTLGFVRRGLAGELVGLFPEGHYFTALSTLRWAPTAALTIGIGILAHALAFGSERTDRRIMLALITPLFPWAFAYGMFSPRPDAFGATALICFAVAVKSADSERQLKIVSALYGVTMIILTLIHEGTPFFFTLGALAALAVLAHDRSEKTLQFSAAIAIVPGILTALAITLLGRRGISAQLCDLIPHGLINHPAAGQLNLYDVLKGSRFEIDYHGWMCRNITPLYDQTILDAAHFVASLGVIALAASTALGVALLALTILAVRHVSGVPFSRMSALLHKRASWSLLGLALFVPIFVTGIDWTRWWLTIAFDIGVVYLLFASAQAESTLAPTSKLRSLFFFIALMMAAPLGSVPAIGFPLPL